ncbi:MAG: hypothetical protein ACRCXT_21135 [Paraclostridium sp.]
MNKPKQLYKKAEERVVIPVDDWIPNPEDVVIKHTKQAIIIPVSKLYGMDGEQPFDYFILQRKRAYMGEKVREHTAQYLNYFIKFYDNDNELISIYYKFKVLIDTQPGYDKFALAYDIMNLILSQSMLFKVNAMVQDNYILDLDNGKVKISSDSLKYVNHHGKVFMKISMLINILIPILTHFLHINVNDYPTNTDVQNLLLEFFTPLLDMFDCDMYSKLYETTTTRVAKNVKSNPIWGHQSIRGINPTTHVLDAMNNTILNVIPKYTYNFNMINLNYTAIEFTTKYKVTDIGYELDFIPVSSSNRDEDNNSEFDKFESYLIKQDESLYIQNNVNCNVTMRALEEMYGPFDEEELKFYKRNITQSDNPNEFIVNSLQLELVFNLFYKYFGAPVSIKAINSDDCIKLILIAKKILQSSGLQVLPYILSSKPTRITPRKNINKGERFGLESSELYTTIVNKYKNDKVINYIVEIIATLISSEFQIVDYDNPDLHGKMISCPSAHLCSEIQSYIILI